MQFSFPAAKILQKLHICKHSGDFLSNKMKFYGLNGLMGHLFAHVIFLLYLCTRKF